MTAPNKPITALPSASTLSGTEPLETVQGGISVKTTAQNIANLAPGSAAAVLVESGSAKKISAMTAAGALGGTEAIAVVQAGATVKTTAQAIANLATSGMTVRQESSTNYPLVLSDAEEYIQFISGSPISLIIPTNAVAFPIGTTILGEQAAAGIVTVSATGGVTLHSAGGLVASNGQYATFSLVKVGTNEWRLMGNLA